MSFTQTIRPYLLTPRLAHPRRGRRRPSLFLSPAGFLVYALCAATFYMTAYALTLTWDFGVIVYVGVVYAIVALVRKLRSRRVESVGSQ